MARVKMVRAPMEIARAADDLPSRVLYLTFEEDWVFNQFCEHARTVYDGSNRVAVAQDDNTLMTQLELENGDMDEKTVRDIVERFEQAGIIERVAVTGGGDTIAFKFNYNPEDIRIVDIKSRPAFRTPEAHMRLVRAMTSGDGPDPNTVKTWKTAFAKWLKKVHYEEGPTTTINCKLRGYRIKDPARSASLCTAWGIWYYDTLSSRWLLAFEQFLPLSLTVSGKPPIMKGKNRVVDAKLAGDHTEPAAQPTPTATPPLSPEDRIARIRRERDGLETRNKMAFKLLKDFSFLEDKLREIRAEHDRNVLTPVEEQRLSDLTTALRILESVV